MELWIRFQNRRLPHPGLTGRCATPSSGSSALICAQGRRCPGKASNFDFTGVVFDGGDFNAARFSGGNVLFNGAEFSGGLVSFYSAEFSGGEVSFGGAKFSGGQVTFIDTEFRSHPPVFGWDGEPPAGVVLPD